MSHAKSVAESLRKLTGVDSRESRSHPRPLDRRHPLAAIAGCALAGLHPREVVLPASVREQELAGHEGAGLGAGIAYQARDVRGLTHAAHQ